MFEGLAYDVPRGCIGAYYPECNVLIPLSHHAEEKQSSRRQVGAGPHLSGRLNRRQNFVFVKWVKLWSRDV